MKIRNGFVSNSSSSSFIIKNISKSKKTMIDFVNEVGYSAIAGFASHYGDGLLSKEDLDNEFKKMLENCSESYELKLAPREAKSMCFGDEDGTTIGRVFDYMLRDGGKSKSFQWYFESCRGNNEMTEEERKKLLKKNYKPTEYW